MNKIKVAVCDDATFFCKSIFFRCETEEDIDFVAEAHDEDECIAMVKEVPIDVLLLDIQMKTRTSGIDIIEELKKIRPEMKIVILTSYENEEYIFSAFLNGADDYLVKGNEKHNVISCIRNVYNNISALRPEIAQYFTKQMNQIREQQNSLIFMMNTISKLSPAEFEILKASCMGKSYKEIAKEKVVEECTVRTLASRVLKKFNVLKMKELVDSLNRLGFDRFFK